MSLSGSEEFRFWGSATVGEWKDGNPTGTGKITITHCTSIYTSIYLKNWRQVFPGMSKKKQKGKRRASKDQEALILQFKKMAEETMKEEPMKLPEMKMARMERPAAAMMVTEE